MQMQPDHQGILRAHIRILELGGSQRALSYNPNYRPKRSMAATISERVIHTH